MGYGKRDNDIDTYWPDDTEKEFFISQNEDTSLEDILEKVKAKWPDKQPADIGIEPEYIHTDCLYFDRYDAGDFTRFIRVFLKEQY